MAPIKPNLQARSESYLARLQRRNAKFQDNFTNFLNHDTKKLLIIEMGSMLLSVLSVHQILSNLEEKSKNRYGGGADSIFLSWEELVSDIGDSEVIPKFPNLVVLEFDKSAINEQDMKALRKIEERLLTGPSWKKVVLVASEKGRLNNVLQELQSDIFGFLEEPTYKNIPESTRKSKNLSEAASKGLLDEVETFIENGAEIDQVDADGNTALHLAAQSCHKEVVSTLLKYRAKHLHNKKEDTALHLAAKHGHVDIVMLLLKHGVDVNIMGNEKYSPLHYASVNGHKEVVLTLLQHGAKHLQNDSTHTPLHLAALEGHGDTVIALLEYGADVNAMESLQMTPLHIASWNGQHDVVRTLLLYDANIQATDNCGYTALHNAADKGHKRVVNTVLEFGAEVDAKNTYGSTPLHLAAHNGHLEVVKLLIEMANANLNCKDNMGKTPMDRAKKRQHTGTVEYLTSKGAT